MAHLGEKTLQEIVGDFGNRAVGIKSGPSLVDRNLADIGAEHLDRVVSLALRQELHQQHGDRVRFFSG